MPVHFIAAEGFDACKPHGGQTQESLLRALGGRVKCPQGESTPCSGDTFKVACGGDSDYIIGSAFVRMEAFPPEKSPCKAGDFSRANGSKPFDRHKLLE
jgi:hypothetical protein